jgi:hypothetical protein
MGRFADELVPSGRCDTERHRATQRGATARKSERARKNGGVSRLERARVHLMCTLEADIARVRM